MRSQLQQWPVILVASGCDHGIVWRLEQLYRRRLYRACIWICVALLAVAGLKALHARYVQHNFIQMRKTYQREVPSPDGRWVASIVTVHGNTLTARCVALSPVVNGQGREWKFLFDWPWPEVPVKDLRWVSPELLEVACWYPPSSDIPRAVTLGGTAITITFAAE